MEALRELGRLVAFIVLKMAEVIISAVALAIVMMAVAFWGLTTFVLGIKVDDKGELGYR